MSKILIAIVSCEAHKERAKVCLETWASRGGEVVDYVCENPSNQLDVIVFDGEKLSVPDDYRSLPRKVKAICEWALARDYDFVFKCDSDTYVFLSRLLASGFEIHDYTGFCQEIVPEPDNYASGGCGYWLSRKAMEIVANAKLTADACEDRWVGHVLYDSGIKLHRDIRYAHGEEREPFKDKTLVTYHPATPKRMRELFEVNQ